MRTSASSRILSGFFALTLVVAAGCGSDSSTTTDSGASAVPGNTYNGVLDDGSTVSLTFTTTAAALVANRAATASTIYTVNGTLITASGTSIPVTGSYDTSTGKFHVTAGAYTLDGTYASGVFTGTYTGPNGSKGALVAGNAATATRYCGSYTGSDSGAFMIVVAGSKALLVVKGSAAEGSATGSNVSFTVPATSDHPTITVNGTVSATTVSGTWSAAGSGSGNWSGSTTACR